MGRWVRKTPTDPMTELPVARPELADGKHECQLPAATDVGARSIWECDCGLRWRIAVPHWRPMAASSDAERRLAVPQWVISISDHLGRNSSTG
jgi:hypothetical protein